MIDETMLFVRRLTNVVVWFDLKLELGALYEN